MKLANVIHSFTLEGVRDGLLMDMVARPKQALHRERQKLQTHTTLFWTIQTEQILWDILQTQWMEKWLAGVMYICINKAQKNSRELFLAAFGETRLWLHYL